MEPSRTGSPAHAIGTQLSGLMANIKEKLGEIGDAKKEQAFPTEDMTRHFKLVDFFCPCCKRLRTSPRLYEHARMLDKLQELLGFPIEVTSGYLCQEHIRVIGMNPGTQHNIFATDVKPKEIVTGREMLTIFMAAQEIGFTGVILHDDHIHLDLRLEPLCLKV